jgi:hypothetical protein
VKKKLILSTLGLVIIVFVLLFALPLSFDEVFDGISDDADIYILITDSWIESVGNEVFPRLEFGEYRLQSDSEELNDIREILSRYSYRRIFRTLLSDAPTLGNDAGYWIQIWVHDPEWRVVLSTGGTGEIIVGNRIYRIGFRGNKVNLEMMGEIRSVLDD